MMEHNYQPGQRVIWTHEVGGWGWVYRTPATVVKVTARRVQIDAELKNGGTVRRSVTPEKLKPMPEASDGCR